MLSVTAPFHSKLLIYAKIHQSPKSAFFWIAYECQTALTCHSLLFVLKHFGWAGTILLILESFHNSADKQVLSQQSLWVPIATSEYLLQILNNRWEDRPMTFRSHGGLSAYLWQSNDIKRSIRIWHQSWHPTSGIHPLEDLPNYIVIF